MGSGEIQISDFDHYVAIDEDRVNLLGKFRPPGSGQRWFGDEFSTTRVREYSVEIPNIVPGSTLLWTMDFAGRCDETSQVGIDINGSTFSGSIGPVATGEVEADFAKISRLSGTTEADNNQLNVRISYPPTAAASSGWLDFVELQAKRRLQYGNDPLIFRSIVSRDYATAQYIITGVSSSEVLWDITNPQTPIRQQFGLNGTTTTFGVETNGLIQEFVLFSPTQNFPTPVGVGSVANQNIHGLQDADLVIIYHRDFEEAALRLAAHRLEHNGYLVEAIPVDLIMNEFAGGGQDPTAIRDFARMLKSRSSRFRWLLLMGDGSYDMRHLNQDQADKNFIPVFETVESMHPIKSFPSDDYFALLSDEEGFDLKGAIEIAVGRIPVSTPEEANNMVSKIIHYDTHPATHGDWRLDLTYVADDEDGNQHLVQTEDVANTQQALHSKYNIRKIYLDAYQQMNSPGGDRYPDVNAAINAAVQQGSLILNYFGHGGPSGWTQERVLGIPDIQSWTNLNKLPLFITATCSFTPYDEPSIESAGEQVLLNPAGGAIALLTTVRAVYSSSNKRLTSEVFERILLEDGPGQLSIGEVMVLAKNSNHQDTVDVNARKFAIIGDPSLKIVIPEHEIVITRINGNNVDVANPDTVRALDHTQLSGEIRDKQGNKLTQFNGILTATVFDKPTKLTTLANDPKSYEQDFQIQSKVLFKGSVSVVNGDFTLAFVMPQDISFKHGNGKISMYATDQIASDAAGLFTDFIIGGSATGITDTEGPVIQIFADNENFRSGDQTGPNPTMIIQLSDASGINITGNSIGHDLEGVLDENSRTSYVLNERYAARIDDPTHGEVILPLYDLEPGLHTFRVVAWDIANNYSEETIEFVVVENLDEIFINLRNGPNPFSTNTSFAFEHRLGDIPATVEIEVFTVTGRLVQKKVVENIVSDLGSVSGLEWDGGGLAGGRILPGVYFYRVRMITRPGTSEERAYESDFEKLILMD
jgi:hypothetical protein